MATHSRSPFIWRPCIRIPSEWQEQLRDVGVYFSGGLFTLGWWFFIDGLVSANNIDNYTPRRGFEDWLPGLICTLGMIVINSIDFSILYEDDGFGYDNGGSASKAKFVLFMGIALLGGGLAGSLVILIVKFVHPEIPADVMYTGITNVLQSLCILSSCLILFFVHNYESSSYQGIRLQ
ncbi:Vacuolar protein sorting-associated protein 68 [Mycoemilia scoparia]|uniref:Vacuolar protein sorting-associated protein 68 n=1 Tax=Mycoemilia scoparia TaxID=417184 RepID=A0A9W8A1Y4_9FUNG|nr:Vacuolar protein sorting-associated protein 68 [Mycoemilia scoparia]